MAYELIDYLLIFWSVLAVVVYILGKVLEERAAATAATGSSKTPSGGGPHNRKASGLARDDWSPYSHLANNSGGQLAGSTSDYYGQQAGHRRGSGRAPPDAYNSNEFNYQQQQQQHYDRPTAAATSPYNQQHSTSSYAYTNFDRQEQSHYGNYLQSTNLDRPLGAAQQAGPNKRRQQDQDNDLYRRQQSLGDETAANSSSTIYSTIPTATGYNSDCIEWVNEVMYLFYTSAHKYDPIIVESVARSLNEKLSNITAPAGHTQPGQLADGQQQQQQYQDLILEITSIDRESSTRPELTNLRTELESDRAVSATCKIYNKRIAFNLSIRRRFKSSATTSGASYQEEDCDEMSNEYELVLENLEGKLKSTAMLNDKLIVIQFLEKPDTKILLKPRGQSRTPPLISEDNLVQIILQTLTQVVVDLYFGDDIDFPQYKQQHQQQHQSTLSGYKNKLNTILRGSASELKRQIKHDFFGTLSSSSSHDKERKLFVKLVRAKNINYNQNVTCLVELDQPPQQALTSTKSGSSNPAWDEHFLFSIGDKSAWLVLELWDSLQPPSCSGNGDPPVKRNPAERSSSFKGHNRGASSTTTATATATATPATSIQARHQQYNKQEMTANAVFLGLARVSVDELRRNPVQKTSLLLQPIGDDLSNSVGGELQVELLFLEHSALPDASHNHGSSMSSMRKFNSAHSLVVGGGGGGGGSSGYQQGDLVSIDRKLTPSGYVITTTTITKPNAAELHRQQQQQQQLAGRQDPALMLAPSGGNQSPVPSLVTTDQSLLDADLDGLSTSQLSGASTSRHQQHHQQHLDEGQSQAPSEVASGAGAAGASGRSSRSRSRSRSLLKAIKKRFSFSRTRSRSVGGEPGCQLADQLEHSPGIRSEAPSAMSQESRTSRASSVASAGAVGRAKSVPASRDPSEIPTIVINRNRLSDTASAFTFAHPKSQLVIEVLEPTLREDGTGNTTRDRGRLCYYAIPDDGAMKRKWSKRGLKLHLFNEHQFVACHLAGSSTCHLCGRVFSRRPGKQGYKCRNCHLLSHKQCHVKVDHNCPYATRDGLRLEYIDVDPPATLVDELNRQQSAGGQNDPSAAAAGGTQRVRPMRTMAAKSISMEMEDR